MPWVTFCTSSKVNRSKVKVTRPVWVDVQVPTFRGWGHIVASPLQAAQLVKNYLPVRECSIRVLGSESRRKGSDAPSLFGSLSSERKDEVQRVFSAGW